MSKISKSLEILFKSGNPTILRVEFPAIELVKFLLRIPLVCRFSLVLQIFFRSFTILHICYIQLLPSQLAVFDMLFMAFLPSHFQIAFFSSHSSINSTLKWCSFVSQAIQICFHLRWDSLPSF